MPNRPGFRKNWRDRPLDEAAQSLGRVQEVERVAGRRRVQHQQVVAALLEELVQLLGRHVLLRARDRVGQLLIDAVVEDPVTRLLVGRVALHEVVEGALGVDHHGPQLPLHLDALVSESRRVHKPLLVAQLGQSERVRQPFRRVDGQHQDLLALGCHAHGDRRRGGRLAHPARAGAHAHLLVGQDVPDVHRASSISSASCSMPSMSSSGRNRNGSSTTRWREPFTRVGQLLPVSRRPPVLGHGRPQRGSPQGGDRLGAVSALLAVEQVLEERRLVVGEQVGVDAVHEDPLQLHTQLLAQRALQVKRLVHRHLLRPRDGADGGQLGVGDQSVDVVRLPLDRAHPGDVAEGLGRSEHAEAVPGGGRIDDHDVVLGRLLDPPVELRQLPDLADRDELSHPGRGGGEVGEDPVLEQQVVERLHLYLQQQVLLQRALRVDREGEQVGGDLGLVVADALVVEQPGHALLLRHLADDRAFALPGCGDAEGRGDGRLADTALPGHEDDALAERRAGRALSTGTIATVRSRRPRPRAS